MGQEQKGLPPLFTPLCELPFFSRDYFNGYEQEAVQKTPAQIKQAVQERLSKFKRRGRQVQKVTNPKVLEEVIDGLCEAALDIQHHLDFAKASERVRKYPKGDNGEPFFPPDDGTKKTEKIRLDIEFVRACRELDEIKKGHAGSSFRKRLKASLRTSWDQDGYRPTTEVDKQVHRRQKELKSGKKARCEE